MHRQVPAPGSLVWIRERPWRVDRAQLDRGVVRLDVSDRHDRLTFLSPYDRPTRTAVSGRAVCVRRQHARARLAEQLAGTSSLTTLVSARDARIELWPHQLEAALAASAGHRRILIADEVGLGKTIQAGLIVSELSRRLPACRALVIAPAGLCDQWAEELDTRFSIASRRADRDTFTSATGGHVFGRNPWGQPGVWISSADYLKQPHVFQGQPLEPWDVIVIDEAHTATGASDRHHVCDELGRRARCLVLLSATPHSGDAARFTRLMTLGALPFDRDEPLVLRRTRAQTSDAPADALRPGSSGAFPLPRHVRWHRLGLPEPVARLFDALRAFERVVLERAGASHRDAALLLLAVYRKRALSTIDALGRTLARREAWLDDPRHSYHLDWLQPSLAFGDEEDDATVGERTALTGDLGVPTFEERAWLNRLQLLTRRAAPRDPKLARIYALVSRTAEPVIVFTEFRHSLESVDKLIQPVRKTSVLHGGQTLQERRTALARFLDGHVSVLVTTDVGGQGLNLQARSRWVINLELPWNPARLEQRVGRVDRIGQRRRVHFTILVARHAFENHLLCALARRTLAAKQAFGSTVFQDVPPPAETALAASLLGDVTLVEPAVYTPPVVVSRRWVRPARAMARVLRRKRVWARQWRGPIGARGRPVSARGSFGRLPGTNTGPSPSTLLGFRVPLVEESGVVAERHLVVVRVDAALASTSIDPMIVAACCRTAERVMGARLRRAGRIAKRRLELRQNIESSVARHLDTIRRPEEAQLGLFSHKTARASDERRAEHATAADHLCERVRSEEQAAGLSIGQPELVWIWNAGR